MVDDDGTDRVGHCNDELGQRQQPWLQLGQHGKLVAVARASNGERERQLWQRLGQHGTPVAEVRANNDGPVRRQRLCDGAREQRPYGRWAHDERQH